MNSLVKVFPLIKADEKTRKVYGLVTAETQDKSGEVCNYADAVKAYKAWSSEAQTATANAGQEISLGNVRIQHVMSKVGGKVTNIVYDDDNKQILVETEPIDETMFNQIKKGFFTGYSHGGDYAYRNCAECDNSIPQDRGNFCKSCNKTVLVKYAPVLAEISYVDNPGHGSAHFQLVKTDGSSEILDFTKGVTMETTPAAVTEAQIQAMVKTALATIQNEQVTAAEKAKVEKSNKVKAYLTKAVEAVLAKLRPDGLKKSLYDVSRFASLLCEFAYLTMSARWEAAYEEDGSTVPDELQEDLEGLVESFLAMAEEETSELTAQAAGKEGMAMSTTTAGLAKANTTAIIGELAKGIKANNDAMIKQNETLTKLLGALAKEHKGGGSIDKQGQGEVTPIDPEALASECIAEEAEEGPINPPRADKAAAGTVFTEAQVSDIVNKAVQAVVKQLSKAAGEEDDEEDDEEEPKPKGKGKGAKKAAAGIGNRDDASAILGNGGPVVRVMPVSKAGENRMTDAPAAVAASAETINEDTVRKAIGNGDIQSQLVLMRASGGPMVGVPATVAGVVGSLGKGRR